MHLTVRTAELPEDAGGCQGISDIEYRRWNVGQREVLIPRESRFRVLDIVGGDSLNVTSYASCREYVGESVLRFEDPASPPSQPVERGPAPPPFPAGLRFECRIVTPIDSDTAAAGDALEAVLQRPIRDADGAELAPAGARIHARLFRVVEKYFPREHFEIAIRFESIELNGVQVPFAADNRQFAFATRHLRLTHLVSTWTTAQIGHR